MSKARLVIALLSLSAASLMAQGAPKTAARAAGGTDSVIPIEQSLWDALVKNDYASFNKALGADFIYVSGDGAVTWERAKSAEMLKDCKTGKATFTNIQEKRVSPDLTVLTYTANSEQVCGGKKSPNPVNALSVWRKVGGQWVAIAHSETPVSAGAK